MFLTWCEGGRAHWALHHRYIQIGHFRVKGHKINQSNTQYHQGSSTNVSKFMLCISEIFLENFETFYLKSSNFVIF